tara:strand:+ start:787 stop:1239 length:453 start_codon:yes stop_codon:yes gene_type:complete
MPLLYNIGREFARMKSVELAVDNEGLRKQNGIFRVGYSHGPEDQLTIVKSIVDRNGRIVESGVNCRSVRDKFGEDRVTGVEIGVVRACLDDYLMMARTRNSYYARKVIEAFEPRRLETGRGPNELVAAEFLKFRKNALLDVLDTFYANVR